MACDLPIDGDGNCMKCKTTPPEAEALLCRTCATPWHVQCLSQPPETMASVVGWLCPDCSPPSIDDVAGGDTESAAGGVGGGSSDLVAMIRAIEADETIDEKEKARRRQALVSGQAQDKEEEDEETRRREKGKKEDVDDVLDLLDDSFNCSICMQLPERPVTTPCGHNFCLKCFEKWVRQSKLQCANCRAPIPSKFASQPRINSALVAAIRMARAAKSASAGASKVYHFMRDEARPEKAFTTDRAKRAGKANACSGQIFVTVPPDHFGPIPAENDPKRNQGVLVGESWEDRLECRQWGAHLPHVAGIAGQSDYGSQSVALSGGYVDDEDHGEWFLYTGSGGRDLSGNKRTNKEQSFDQKFEKMNQALRVSCLKGYPVRVVRSFKEKRSSYAPEKGVRYDGVYRIEKCWRKPGIQGFKVCRYLFVRCDNEPAPWTSDDHGDRPRPLPVIKELKVATDVTERKDSPSWDYDEEKGWMWVKAPPVSKKPVRTGDPSEQSTARRVIRLAQNTNFKKELLKKFTCPKCCKLMDTPVSTPCGHSFCKQCLVDHYDDQSFLRERFSTGGRTLRAQKIVKKCPLCPADIADFLKNPKVNFQILNWVEKHNREEKELAEKAEENGIGDADENEVEAEAKLEPLDENVDENKVEAPENGALEEDSAEPPQKRIKLANEEIKITVAADNSVDSPSSPLTAAAQDDELE